MGKQVFRITVVISLAIAIMFAPFHRNISAGIVLGTLFSLMNLTLLENSFKAVMKQDVQNPFSVILTNMFRLILMAIPMYIAVSWPKKISIIGVGIGILLFLPALVINTIRKGEQQ